MLGTFTVETFEDKVGQAFQVQIGGGQAVETRLLSVRALEAKTSDGKAWPSKRAPFSLTFLGPSAPRLPQQTYQVAHEILGQHPIFLVAVGMQDGGFLYEAVFA